LSGDLTNSTIVTGAAPSGTSPRIGPFTSNIGLSANQATPCTATLAARATARRRDRADVPNPGDRWALDTVRWLDTVAAPGPRTYPAGAPPAAVTRGATISRPFLRTIMVVVLPEGDLRIADAAPSSLKDQGRTLKQIATETPEL
jgi:hypothetical protein